MSTEPRAPGVCWCFRPGTSRIPTRGSTTLIPTTPTACTIRRRPGTRWRWVACTELVRITEPDTDEYTPIAPRGGLSPFSTTSLTWEKFWPLKPDVVLEGGNAAKDLVSAVTADSLSLLTAHHRPNERSSLLLPRRVRRWRCCAARGTNNGRLSGVVAGDCPGPDRPFGGVDGGHATRLVAHNPRGHEGGLPTSGSALWVCVPDLDRALWSVDNSLTMVVEERLHPFQREGSKSPTLRDMHLYNLPWPREELEGLGDTEVEMRVTCPTSSSEPLAARSPFPVPIRVPWSPFRREATP